MDGAHRQEADELFQCGNALHEDRRWQAAADAYARSLTIDPSLPEAHNNLGNTLLNLGRHAEAIESFDRAIALRPSNPEALYNRGIALQTLDEFEQAADSYRAAIEVWPEFFHAWNNLGTALQRLGKLNEALESLQRAATLDPNSAAAQNNLGSVLLNLARAEEARACFQRAIALCPAAAEAHNNLGNALRKLGRVDEAIEAYREAARLRPDSSEVFNNFANVLKETGRLDEALACYDRAIAQAPDDPVLYNNLANTFKEAGQLDEAIACYRKALAIRPDFALAHSGLLYTLYFDPTQDAQSICREHRIWNERHARPLRPSAPPHANPRDANRRLRIGYVSPDFRDHVVGRFMLPLLAHHDCRAFEIVCYSDVARPDAMTDRLRSHVARWQNTAALSDERLARLVRDDRIDILVDLTMHMAGSRLLAFARKPAPVQVTYLAYCGTTGLEAMDYRLTDPYLDPLEGQAGAEYVERSIRLPRTYWCYAPPDDAPAVNELPLNRNSGAMTFGCLNNFSKVSRPVVETWCTLLHARTDARLILHANLGTHRQRLLAHFAHQGIDPARIDFIGFLPLPQYLATYHRIDLALDPFPYAGGTTTCDALWMGVPVVTLSGPTAVGRGGASILTNVGLPDLIAHSPKQYVQLALALADNPGRLQRLRSSMRDRMRGSLLMDAPAFARDVEASFRMMWTGYCNQS